MRVLFVEDEPRDYRLYIEAVGTAATDRGGTLEGAAALDEALRMVQDQPYDVVVVDLNIPLGPQCPPGYTDGELNGKHLVSYLRDHYPGTRIVCMTNYALKAKGELTPWPGITIIPKSCTRSALVQAVFP